MSENIILLFQKSFLPYLIYQRYLAHFLQKEYPKNHVIVWLDQKASRHTKGYLAKYKLRLAGHPVFIF